MFAVPRRDAWPDPVTVRRSNQSRARASARVEGGDALRGLRARPREACRTYDPSAEHLHAGNDWVHSVYAAVDDYDNPLNTKAPNRALHNVAYEWPDAFRGGAAAVAPPAGKWAGGTRRDGRRDASGNALSFDGGKKSNSRICELSRESPFFKGREDGRGYGNHRLEGGDNDGARLLSAQRRAKTRVKTSYAPQLVPHPQNWRGSGGSAAQRRPQSAGQFRTAKFEH
jgi:hypothetical protein